jgi:acyl carrier protein
LSAAPPTPTERKLQTIVAYKLQMAPEKVPLDQSLLEDLGLDSFDLMAVILEVEESFKPVSFADKSAQDLRTLREVAAYIDHELELG